MESPSYIALKVDSKITRVVGIGLGKEMNPMK